jgi:hypothetical protein
MSGNIERLIAEETTASEKNPDAPLSAGAALSRPNRKRSAVYSIRLDPDEVAALHARAEETGLPASTLARSWIVDQLRATRGEFESAEAELHAAQVHLAHLQRHLTERTS